MGCEVSLAAGDLPSAASYADRLAALPVFRDYVHPALASGAFRGEVREGMLGEWHAS